MLDEPQASVVTYCREETTVNDPGRSVSPETLDANEFAPYGRVLSSAEPGFSVVLTPSHATTWIVGINNVEADELTELHRHVDTWECFSPLTGKAFIAVAPPRADDDASADLGRLRIFVLDSPVAIAPGTYHCMIRFRPGEPSSVFVCENQTVTGSTYRLPEAVRVR